MLLAAETWGTTNVLALISLPVLIGLNGLFVAAEFSLVAVRRTRMEEIAERGVKGANLVLAAIAKLDHIIAATQLGITLSSIALGWVAENSLEPMVKGLFIALPGPFDWLASHTVAGTLAFLLITFLHVIFGELVPKSFALQAPDRVALMVVLPLHIFEIAARPLIWLVNAAGNLIVRMVGLKPSEHASIHSVAELSMLIEDTEEAGILDPDQAELLQNVFELSNKTVASCMVPRDKMAALELSMPPDKVLDAVRDGAHTRMPVYHGDIDHIVGIVNTKDLFYLFSLKGVVILDDALYPALFLRPDEEIANALRLFRRARRPMAVVRDEDGKTLGLITLEDILEEIIGDIEDEHDRPVRRINPSLLRVRRLKKPPVPK